MSSARILKIFLLFALSGMVFMPLTGAVQLRNRFYLEQDNSGSGDEEFLRAALRRIDSWARDAKVKHRKIRVFLRSGEKKWGFLESKDKQFILLKGNSGDWKRSFEMRQIIYGVLFRSRFAELQPKDPAKSPLPAWMTAAVDEAISNRRSNAQYYSGNRNYQPLQLIVKTRLKLPDFAAMCRFETLPSDPASRMVFHQMSLLLMEISAEHGLLEKMISAHASGRSADNWVGLFSSPQEAQLRLTDLAGNFLWNRRTPQPAELFMEKLQTLQKITLPELDSKNVPTGKMLSLDFHAAHRIMKESDRPDNTEIRRYYSGEWRKLARRKSMEIQEICYQLSETVNSLGIDNDTPDKLNKLISELQLRLERNSNIATELITASFRELPLFNLYRLDFTLFDISARAAATREIEKFMEESEKKYLENY